MASTVVSVTRPLVDVGLRPLPAEANPALLRLAAYALALLLVAHATFRGSYADLDSVIYSSWYQELAAIDASDFLQRLLASGWVFAPREDSLARFEWGFSLLGWLLGAAGAPVELFYAVAASLSLLPKAYLAVRYTRHPVLAMVWYASFCYLLLEMNAMRAGIAAALMLMALVPLYQQRRVRYTGLVLLAAAFHLSALFALLLLLYARWRISALSLAVALLVALGLSFVDLTVVLGLLGGAFAKISEYKAALDSGFGDVAYLRINPLNLSSVGFLALGLLLMTALAGRRPQDVLTTSALAIYFLPLLVLFSFASFPIVAGRLSELLCIYQVLMVVRLLDKLPLKLLGQFAVLTVAGLQFYILNFRTFNVDFFYFIGAPKREMISLIEQKIAIDAVLNSLFSNL